MSRVMVHVKCKDCKNCDMELPAYVPADKLGGLIARALEWKESPHLFRYRYTIQAQPIGRTLQPGESLAQANLWDGAYLTLTRQAMSLYWLQSTTGQKYLFIASRFLVGRTTADDAPSQEILMDLGGEPNGQSVSRRQARLTLRDGVWLFEPVPEARERTFVYQNQYQGSEAPSLKDKGWLSFEEISQPYRLQDEGWIRFGNVPMKFCVDQS